MNGMVTYPHSKHGLGFLIYYRRATAPEQQALAQQPSILFCETYDPPIVNPQKSNPDKTLRN